MAANSKSDASLVVYAAGTPNGWVPLIFLEELKDVYGSGPDYETIKMSISDADIGKVHNQVKSPWFIEGVNPNGRIPAITHNGFSVFETSAILLYLANEFDTERKLSKEPSDTQAYSVELQWLFFAHGGVGPMQGQADHFNIFAKEKIPYAIDRYLNETRRLYSVLETRLSKSPYLAGETYGLADIKTFGWVRIAGYTGVDIGEFPVLKAWCEKCEARPAWGRARRGLDLPENLVK